MSIKEDILKGSMSARKEKDKEMAGMYQLLLSTIQNEEIKLGKDISEDSIISILKKDIVKYKESSELGIDPRAQDKIDVLSKYVPAQLDEKGILKVLEDNGATKGMGIGQLIGIVMKEHKKFVDGALVQKVVKEHYL